MSYMLLPRSKHAGASYNTAKLLRIISEHLSRCQAAQGEEYTVTIYNNGQDFSISLYGVPRLLKIHGALTNLLEHSVEHLHKLLETEDSISLMDGEYCFKCYPSGKRRAWCIREKGDQHVED